MLGDGKVHCKLLVIAYCKVNFDRSPLRFLVDISVLYDTVTDVNFTLGQIDSR